MKKVIVECGHGGMIDGEYQCIASHPKSYRFEDGFEVFEGVINRRIGSKLEHRLQLAGIPLISLSTHDQSDLRLQERTNRINKWYEEDPNIFVLSIHSNKMTPLGEGKSQAGRGFEAYTNAHGKYLGALIERSYKEEFPNYRWRGTYVNNTLWMLKASKPPTVLIENLFYDNRQEAEFLVTEAGQQLIVNALFNFVKEAIKY